MSQFRFSKKVLETNINPLRATKAFLGEYFACFIGHYTVLKLGLQSSFSYPTKLCVFILFINIGDSVVSNFSFFLLYFWEKQKLF